MQINHKKETGDLKRFNKNKKQKEIIIGSIIAIVVIIGGISLYRSFAMYEEKASFDVLKGTIPDFSTKDINLAFTINGKTDANAKFPNKGEGYMVEEVDCEDNVTADWNNGSWSLENIKNNGTSKKVKCTVAFKTIDTTSGLNGAEPVLGDGMIPVIINESGKAIKTTQDNKEWYDYKNKKWANAVILTEDGKEQQIADNGLIDEQYIESYFVWIPKFSYQLFDMGKYVIATNMDTSKQNKAINIKFGVVDTSDSVKGECTTPMNEDKTQGLSEESWHCDVGEWMTHPAFLAFDTTGFWVGKFETSQSSSNGIQIKPNVTSWINITMGDSFRNSKNYQSDLQSHLIKNTEWGAVAYLAQSIYGRCDKEKNTCTEVSANSNGSYYTGYTGGTPYFNNSTGASTTGNYSGIYDMSGCTWEWTASVMLDTDNETKIYAQSTLTDNDLKDLEYYDVYNYGIDFTHMNRRILGDATGETGPFKSDSWRYFGSIWGDYSGFPSPNSSFMARGAPWNCSTDGTTCGVFAFGTDNGRAIGGSRNAYGFRIALAIK